MFVNTLVEIGIGDRTLCWIYGVIKFEIVLRILNKILKLLVDQYNLDMLLRLDIYRVNGLLLLYFGRLFVG